MENEYQKKDPLVIDRDATINLTVTNPNADDDEIDLFEVFHNMGKKAGFYIWLLILFVAIGLFIPYIMYIMNKPPLTVSSVVTLNYTVDDKPVSDLTAPDGQPLDLNQITSSYVLQNALDRLDLSVPVSISNLRSNISIQKILTETSSQQQELLTTMIADKNSAAYQQLLNMKLQYENRFVVSLTNGFGNENSRVKVYLKDDELSLILDNILTAYNTYLVETYADLKMPDDEFSFILSDSSDIQQRLDLLNTAMDNLYNYCNGKLDNVKAYRSPVTGYTLNDLMAIIELSRTVDIDYVEAQVQATTSVSDLESLQTYYQYLLRTNERNLDTLNDTITKLTITLANYKNDEILISVQETENINTTKKNTDYYNSLVISQAENYEQLAKLEQENLEIKAKLSMLENAVPDQNPNEIEAEVINTLQKGQDLYTKISDHMDELFNSPTYTNLAFHSTAYGVTKGFFSTNSKRLLIGGCIGAFLALGLWFLDALRRDFSLNRQKLEKAKEVQEG